MTPTPITVSLIRVDGFDLDVANAARVSFDKYEEVLTDSEVRLIDYLARHNHWTPFGHVGAQFRIKAPIFIARQLQKHCVSGDTEVTFCKPTKNGSNGNKRRTIADLYAMWSGKVKYQGGRKGKRNVTRGHVKVFNEDTRRFETSHIVDVIYQGVKQVFDVTTRSGQRLRVTKDHLVMTQQGWKPVGALAAGEDALVTELLDGAAIGSKNQHRDRNVADVVARRNHEKTVCAECGSPENLESDHIVPVNAGGSHEPCNLQTLCRSCHVTKTATERQRGLRGPNLPRLTPVVSVEFVGEEDVYDITVEGWHNFLANGLVVHNCVGLVWNEVSRRYVASTPEFWKPDFWRGKPVNAKQGSDGPLGKDAQVVWGSHYSQLMTRALELYSYMVESGVAPEQARSVLPQSAMTEWIWTGSLAAWARVCKLRLDAHSQAETAEVAKKIDTLMKQAFPVSWSALMTNP